jgi:hypothetical protein
VGLFTKFIVNLGVGGRSGIDYFDAVSVRGWNGEKNGGVFLWVALGWPLLLARRKLKVLFLRLHLFCVD